MLMSARPMRERIESLLENLGHLLTRHAYWVIAGAVLIAGLAAAQIPKIEIRVSTDEFLGRLRRVPRRYLVGPRIDGGDGAIQQRSIEGSRARVLARILVTNGPTGRVQPQGSAL